MNKLVCVVLMSCYCPLAVVCSMNGPEGRRKSRRQRRVDTCMYGEGESGGREGGGEAGGAGGSGRGRRVVMVMVEEKEEHCLLAACPAAEAPLPTSRTRSHSQPIPVSAHHQIMICTPVCMWLGSLTTKGPVVGQAEPKTQLSRRWRGRRARPRGRRGRGPPRPCRPPCRAPFCGCCRPPAFRKRLHGIAGSCCRGCGGVVAVALGGVPRQSKLGAVEQERIFG